MDLSRDEDLPQRSSSFLVGNVFDKIIQLKLASKRAHYLRRLRLIFAMLFFIKMTFNDKVGNVDSTWCQFPSHALCNRSKTKFSYSKRS